MDEGKNSTVHLHLVISMLPLMLISLSWHIPILCISFLNVEVGNDFVNKSARLSLERIC